MESDSDGQVKIEEFTEWKLERITREVLDTLDDDELKRKEIEALRVLRAAKSRVNNDFVKKVRKIAERKKQVKLFNWEEQDGNGEENEMHTMRVRRGI